MYGSTEEQVIACDLITVFSMGQILSHSLNQNDWISNLDSLIKFSFFLLENLQHSSPCVSLTTN